MPRDPYAHQRPREQDEEREAPREEIAGKTGKRRKERTSSNLSVVLQFVIGLLVIAGVAAAIVALYVRYYQ